MSSCYRGRTGVLRQRPPLVSGFLQNMTSSLMMTKLIQLSVIGWMPENFHEWSATQCLSTPSISCWKKGRRDMCTLLRTQNYYVSDLKRTFFHLASDLVRLLVSYNIPNSMQYYLYLQRLRMYVVVLCMCIVDVRGCTYFLEAVLRGYHYRWSKC